MSIKKLLSNIACTLPFIMVCGIVGFLLYTYIINMHSLLIVFRIIFSTIIVYGLVDIFKMYKLTKELIRLNNMK